MHGFGLPDGVGGHKELVALAKADLHVHLVGSASPHTVAKLAARHPGAAVPQEDRALEQFFAFRDFAHFCEVYGMVSALVRDPEDVVDLAVGLAGSLSAQGAGYAEATVTPTAHPAAGIGADTLADALDIGAERASAEHGVELAWVYDVNGWEGVAGGWRTLECARLHAPARLVAFGLGGPEAGVPRAAFRDVFAAARAEGLHSVPHAGESVGSAEIWAAVDALGAERIGHGIAAVTDSDLCRRLCDEGVVLEVCPSSNAATGVVRSLDEHPLPRLLAAGVPLVLGSDDPPMFATSLVEEYRRARDVMGLSAEELVRLAQTSIDASFAPPDVKARVRIGACRTGPST